MTALRSLERVSWSPASDRSDGDSALWCHRPGTRRTPSSSWKSHGVFPGKLLGSSALGITPCSPSGKELRWVLLAGWEGWLVLLSGGVPRSGGKVRKVPIPAADGSPGIKLIPRLSCV